MRGPVAPNGAPHSYWKLRFRSTPSQLGSGSSSTSGIGVTPVTVLSLRFFLHPEVGQFSHAVGPQNTSRSYLLPSTFSIGIRYISLVFTISVMNCSEKSSSTPKSPGPHGFPSPLLSWKEEFSIKQSPSLSIPSHPSSSTSPSPSLSTPAMP